MGVVQIPDELKQVIDRQIIEGRVSSEAEFLVEAVRRYAEALECDEDIIAAAADEGIADIVAGRFRVISGPADMDRLGAELDAMLDGQADSSGPRAR